MLWDCRGQQRFRMTTQKPVDERSLLRPERLRRGVDKEGAKACDGLVGDGDDVNAASDGSTGRTECPGERADVFSGIAWPVLHEYEIARSLGKERRRLVLKGCSTVNGAFGISENNVLRLDPRDGRASGERIWVAEHVVKVGRKKLRDTGHRWSH